LVATAIFAWGGAGGASAADSLTLVTAHSPPFSVVSPDGQSIAGTTTDLLTAALTDAGLQYAIIALPWARALSNARNEADTCAYPAARTAEREHSFKWIGPAETNQWALFGRRGEPPPLSLDHVKGRSIGGSLGDAATHYLVELGYKVDESRDDELNMRKLQTHRIDYWVNNLATGLALTGQRGIDEIVPVLTFKDMPIYLACNLSVPDRVVEALTRGLQRRTAAARTQP
jgi:polar amino acid transport system substrate-binding protein